MLDYFSRFRLFSVFCPFAHRKEIFTDESLLYEMRSGSPTSRCRSRFFRALSRLRRFVYAGRAEILPPLQRTES